MENKNANHVCIECGCEFKDGEYIQAFLRSPDDPAGRFCAPFLVDPDFHDRIIKNKDTVKRKHFNCNSPDQAQDQIAPNCHLCKKEMGFDFSNNIWCKNQSCLLFDEIYDASTYPDQTLVRQFDAVRKIIIADFVNQEAKANKY